MSESDTWDHLRNAMDGLWHVQRHEDKWSTGIPDLSFGVRGVSGWIEMKFLSELTVEQYHRFDFDFAHFRSDQRNWLTARGDHTHNRVYVFLQLGTGVSRAFYLWRWPELKAVLGKKRFSAVEATALGVWPGRVIPGEFVRAIVTNNRLSQLIKVEK